MIVISSSTFVNIVYMERKTMFGFTLVLTSLLVYWILFILMCLVLLVFLLFPNLYILYLSLMFTVEGHGFIFSEARPKSLVSSKSLKFC